MDGIRLYRDIIRNSSFFPSYVSETPQDTSRLFLEGKISMSLFTYTSLSDLKHSEIDYDISAVPNMGAPATLVTITGVLINKNSRNKDAAQRFAEYLVSRETQEKIRHQTLSLPAIKQIAEMPWSDILNRPQHYSLFREIIPSYRFHSDLGLPARSYSSMLHYLKLFWSGFIDEQTLAERLEEL